MIRFSLAGLLVSLSTLALAAQQREPIEQFVAAHQQQIIRELVDLLSIPNVAADRENIRRNAALLRESFLARGFTAELLETPGNPLVFAELRTPGAARTILFYAHYDGQPVDAKTWSQRDPFVPIMRDKRMEDGGQDIANFRTLATFPPEARLYARSASDDKAPIVALLAAIDALKATNQPLTSNVKVILDGEEEARSPSLVATMGRYRDRFRADLMLILDGPLHPSGKPTLAFGARGNLVFQLTTFGPRFALHSGHYGNWAPNPGMDLAQLVASMKNADGRVLVAGFYDDVPALSAEERQILAAVPDRPDDLMRFFGIGRTERVGANLQEALQFPSLNVRGLQSGDIGDQARTIIPDRATAEIDVRLVKETEPEKMLERVLAHIRAQGFHVLLNAEPDEATRARYSRIARVSRVEWTRAYRTDMSLPESQGVIRTLERAWGAPPVRLRTMGGTVPIDFFIQALGMPAIAVPIVNFDNNQHSSNENLRLQNLWDAVVSFAALLRM
ncbi:MAG TPA: M20/M25/M40 family metallo-hydrolase [Vicinamibacterales bacterium]|nr:M20/M25/M40 family metallo-hydrolase [Vicinamibacterales bacterium]